MRLQHLPSVLHHPITTSQFTTPKASAQTEYETYLGAILFALAITSSDLSLLLFRLLFPLLHILQHLETLVILTPRILQNSFPTKSPAHALEDVLHLRLEVVLVVV